MWFLPQHLKWDLTLIGISGIKFLLPTTIYRFVFNFYNIQIFYCKKSTVKNKFPSNFISSLWNVFKNGDRSLSSGLKLPWGKKKCSCLFRIENQYKILKTTYNPMKIFKNFFFLSFFLPPSNLNETLLKVLSSVLFRCTIVSGR